MELKKIALIGQPNVGKSSLFNRILKKRVAIVSDVSGTTRDIRKQEISIFDRPALLLDTGGIDETNDAIFSNVKKMSVETAKMADIILFMVDGKKLPDDKDKELFYELQKLGITLALVINKIDNDKEMERVWEFFEFGVPSDRVFPISVSHNRGTRKLLEWLEAQLPEPEDSQEYRDEDDFEYEEDDDIALEDLLEEEENPSKKEQVIDEEVRVAIIGRPNVGKSSILNALVGYERSVVSNVAGTTIDPVDETVTYKDKKVTFVDTAGLRRRGRIEGIEKFALMRTNEMLENANTALLILDASAPLADLDEKIAGLVDKFALGVIIVLNKWDENMDTYEKIVAEVRRRFKFLHYAPIIAVSAKTKRSIDKLKDKIIQVHENFSQRIPTSKLNTIINEAIIRHSLPSPNGRLLRIYYSTQYKTQPPTIALIMNRPSLLHFSYKRYLINTLRENLNFEGVPIHLVARSRSGNENENDDE
ncbi:ribosome biogenesis GTPase Der [Arcobacter sp. FWKO B]|uniref:ribosome biogenesis GTPase Der n=1 Tax=Arcobacter sp. FWKO B TaxID=2593672 RepID=UPI0018A3C6B5|nr:ribosome biogenesis GTPase Der [Arcobacter sp. FWKO B]QOG11190.1 ribosome biogenesis GTPase Der [Arcobacter sp. FWKO B]